ncbi:MAG: tetratricopeptide repeat protein, partial [Acidobacteriota bacterium]
SGYLFFQMAFPENWGADMEEKVLLKYELYQGDKLVKAWQKDPLNARKLSGAVISVIEPLPLEEISIGHFRLRAFLAGQEGAVLLNGWSAFDVIEDEVDNPVVLTKPFPALESMENSRERAHLYYLQNDNSKAAEMLQKILEFNPEDKYSAVMMASIRMKQRDYDAAKGLLNQLLVKEPNDLALLKLAGECALEMNQYGDAVRFFERVRMQQPEELKNLNQLALAYFALGQRERARELWERSLKLAPEQAEVRRLLQISQEAEQPYNNGKEVVNLLNNKGL